MGFGGLDGATCYSLAEAVLDNDATGTMRRLLGVHAVDEQTSLIDEFLAVGIGGHYLGRRSTRELGGSGLLWEPGIFRRGRPVGEPAQLVREAAAKADEILASHVPAPLAEDVARYAEQVIAEFAAAASCAPRPEQTSAGAAPARAATRRRGWARRPLPPQRLHQAREASHLLVELLPVDRVVGARTLAAQAHEAGVAQDGQMVRDQRLTHLHGEP